jgi:hypothetical protein
MFAPTAATVKKFKLSVDLFMPNPSSLLLLSDQARSIWCVGFPASVIAVRLLGGDGTGIAVGVGVGVGVLPLIWTIFATEGTPFEFRINSM